MPNDQLQNAPNNPVLVEPDSSVITQPHLLSSEDLQIQRLAILTQEVRRLYTWLGLLTGLSVLSLGLLSGFAIWLKMENNQLQRQVSAINTYKAELERVTKLETRINGLESQAVLLNQNIGLLNQQVPKGLPTQLKTIQKEISSLKTAINKVETNAVTRQQMEQSIQAALRNQNQNRLINPSALPTR